MKDWHYPRKDLAEQYLGLLGFGITPSIGVIAPRRKGKTMFMLRDLAPLAQTRGYFPVYASLWQNINAPHEGLIASMESALEVIKKKSTIKRLLKTKIKKATVSNELLGKMEMEFADDPSRPKNKELTYLDRLLSELEKAVGKKQILLMVDEVQHLATSKEFESLAHALRTMLDKRQGEVKSVFTGSSRHYMSLLLNESGSPFYHFVEQRDFPDLDRGFVEFLRDKLLADHEINVSAGSLEKAFKDFDRSPYWMMKLIAQMVTADATVKEAVEFVSQLIEAAEGYEEVSRRMKSIDRLVFLALSNGESPFSKELMRRVDKETDVKGIPSNIQRAIARLSEAGIISKYGNDGYHIEKPGLSRFLEQQSKGERK